MAMDVLVTGGDTELGRTLRRVSATRATGHPAGCAPRRPRGRREGTRRRRHRLRQHRSGRAGRGPHLFPHHLDTIVNVPAPRVDSRRPPRLHADRACRRVAQRPGRHRAVGRADVQMPRRSPALRRIDRQRRRRRTRATAAPRPPSRPPCRIGPRARRRYFGTRGITVNTVASGRSASPATRVVHRRRRRPPPKSPGWLCS